MAVFDVTSYGAVLDGVTDDTDAIEAASAAAGLVGGTVLIPYGTALVHLIQNPHGYPGYYQAVSVRSGCHLIGGEVGTTIRLAPGEPQSGAIVRNLVLDGVGDGRDSGMLVTNLVIDGNGANQTVYSAGLSWTRVRNTGVRDVLVKNVFGDAAFPPGETFHFADSESSDMSYVNCTALGNAGTQGTGFGSSTGQRVTRRGCLAQGMSAGFGYADWTCSDVVNIDCVATACGASGFNAEVSQRPAYRGCRSHDNGGHGFVVNDTTDAIIAASRATGNAEHGLSNVWSSTAEVADSDMSGNVQSDIFDYLSTHTVVSGSYPAEWLSAANAPVYGAAGALTDAGFAYVGTRLAFAINPPATGLVF